MPFTFQTYSVNLISQNKDYWNAHAAAYHYMECNNCQLYVFVKNKKKML